ncbi:hypothetical protein ACFONL_22405 [Camelimonas fluminis]|uniref:Uncharacterized protein n=1 Tax=Camelimonas fluminis TaxID=1576911 RepID=A0ABV7UN05_9HYPH|nr:hypothetical protein [Camelimonas fluminis]
MILVVSDDVKQIKYRSDGSHATGCQRIHRLQSPAPPGPVQNVLVSGPCAPCKAVFARKDESAFLRSTGRMKANRSIRGSVPGAGALAAVRR